MKAPLCRLCNKEHWSWEPHRSLNPTVEQINAASRKLDQAKVPTDARLFYDAKTDTVRSANDSHREPAVPAKPTPNTMIQGMAAIACVASEIAATRPAGNTSANPKSAPAGSRRKGTKRSKAKKKGKKKC